MTSARRSGLARGRSWVSSSRGTVVSHQLGRGDAELEVGIELVGGVGMPTARAMSSGEARSSEVVKLRCENLVPRWSVAGAESRTAARRSQKVAPNEQALHPSRPETAGGALAGWDSVNRVGARISSRHFR